MLVLLWVITWSLSCLVSTTFLGKLIHTMASICIHLMVFLDPYFEPRFLLPMDCLLGLSTWMSENISVTAGPKGSFAASHWHLPQCSCLCKSFHRPFTGSGQQSWLNTNFSIFITLYIDSISKYCPFYYVNFTLIKSFSPFPLLLSPLGHLYQTFEFLILVPDLHFLPI